MTATSSEESRLIRQVYAGALQRDPEERGDYLDRMCANRPELRAKVVALLDAHGHDFGEQVTVTAADASRQAAAGQMVGPYLIRHEIGRGGMGIVYLADDTRLSRTVALKALNQDISGEPGARERFRREARAAAGLSHPGIATVYALEEIGEQLFLASEYVPGDTLRRLVKSGPVPIEQVVDIGLQLARALVVAHTAGVVHRDIKPENVIKTPSGVVKVLDFGLARVEGAVNCSRTGILLGTPAYMSPEQARGQQADFRADLFALGLTLYELASAVNPFAAETVTATIARIVEEDPAPLSQVQPSALPELERIVTTCLQKDPLKRYSSTQELVVDLEELAADLAERRRRSSHDSHPVYNVERFRPRWWWEVHQLVASAVGVLMLYPAWHVRAWLPPPWGALFILSLLATVSAATSLRLHAWFTARFFPSEASGRQAWTRVRTRWCDAVIAALLTAAAAVIAGAHAEFAMLLVAVSTATVVASFVIEPATARAAFPPAAASTSPHPAT
jgi:serine/threonine protein kinase